MPAIDVSIHNGSSGPVTNVLLLDVELTEHPSWTWKRNPHMLGGPGVRAARLLPGDTHGIPVVFYDEDGRRQYSVGRRCGSRVRFTDAGGQRWEIGEGDPRRVPADDQDIPETT
jgi:hypothetical protein